jgi:hypothetical protein
VRRRRDVIASYLPHRRDGPQDHIELTGETVQLDRAEFDPGQRREVATSSREMADMRDLCEL